MSALDIFLRGGVSILLLIIALAFGWQKQFDRKSICVIAVCVGMTAYILVSTPNLPEFPVLIDVSLGMLAATGPVLVYWASAELFLDHLVFKWWHPVAVLIVTVGAWLIPVVEQTGLLRGVVVLLLY
ncbi:MAG: hypothetical protein JKY49_17705, partial [Cohaesibacteraceae bacterium]|nr:hypothetical protein [Cohaesibacteraceae bacterium]